MKRLTIYRDGALEINCENCPETKICRSAELTESDCLYFLTERLAEYEDAEEQGLLVRLPCKVGETVYVTEPRYYNGAAHTGIQTGKVYGFEFDEEWVVWVHLADDNPHSGNAYPIANIGKTVFLTREEAEKALEEV